MSLDPLFKRAFGDAEPTHLGSGWTSGVIAVVGAALSLFAVLCFRFPQLLTAPAFRSHYPVDKMRLLLAGVMVISLCAALISALRRRRKTLAIAAVTLLAVAMLLGGPTAPLPEHVDTTIGLGLDWFVLNVLVLALIFVPLERSRPLKPDQLIFRDGWTIDAVHFMVSHLLVQFISFVVLAPATLLQQRVNPNPFAGAIQALPFWLQISLIIAVADLIQYFIHRSFHHFPVLWKFHAVHHSSPELDWLASSRLHIVEALTTRAIVLIPLVWLGFSPQPLAAYLVFVSFHAVFIHANFGASLRWLEPLLVTPRIHHFHHGKEREAYDKNFAVHLPVYDRLFGTRHLPEGEWPKGYGVEGEVPSSYFGHLFAPFRR